VAGDGRCEGGRRGRLAQLARTTPVLATLHREKQASWQNLLAPEIARRLGADPHDATDPRPRALIAAALSCVEVIIAAWAASNGTQQLPQVLYRAMDSISS
jgi:regulator of sirC expression with transglutaminase-like and TPR domain